MNTYKSTRHAKFLINYHFVWIPKYRKDFLKDPEVKNTVEETIRELSKTYKFDILALEIMPDHIHLFISALPRYSPRVKSI
jgi:putative transposase